MNKTLLRDYRKTKGLTQSEVATACGISLRMYKYYEDDEEHTKKMSLETAIKMAKLFDVNVEDLITDEKEMTNKKRYSVTRQYLRNDGLGLSGKSDEDVIDEFNDLDYAKKLYDFYVSKQFDKPMTFSDAQDNYFHQDILCYSILENEYDEDDELLECEVVHSAFFKA